MISIVFLDAGPLGTATAPATSPDTAACKRWLHSLRNAGVRIIVPDIADYEVRRELLRAGKPAGVRRLDAFEAEFDFLEITSSALRRAAQLWVDTRKAGRPTAADAALDGDVILAAQMLELGHPSDHIVVATSNPKHLARFVPARRWQEIGVEDEREVVDGNGTA